MKQIPEGTKITLSYNMMGQLCASWYFPYKEHKFGEMTVGITESLDGVLKQIEECYQRAKDNYGNS